MYDCLIFANESFHMESLKFERKFSLTYRWAQIYIIKINYCKSMSSYFRCRVILWVRVLRVSSTSSQKLVLEYG